MSVAGLGGRVGEGPGILEEGVPPPRGTLHSPPRPSFPDTMWWRWPA